MIKTLIADDNWKYSKNIINNIINKISELKIDYVTEDGQETLDTISKNYLDLVLLDLQMPKMNGLEVLEQMKKMNLIKIPKVIIISGDLPLLDYASIGNIVRCIILKTEDSESIYEKILRTVNEIKYETNYNDVRNEVIEKLKNMGLSLKHKGTRYLIDCAMYAYGNNNLDIIDNLEKNIYKFVARQHKTSADNIKSNIVKATRCSTKNNINLSPKDIITELVSNF